MSNEIAGVKKPAVSNGEGEMNDSIKAHGYRREAPFVVAFLFLILAVPAQGPASWLFACGGLLALAQGAINLHRARNQRD
jgi:hypothetical protein